MTPQQLRNSILQMAIEGKLTKQLPEDGNADDLLKEIQAEKAKLIAEKKIKKEKLLPEITEDEKPFEIPENWCWCRLPEVGELSRGKSKWRPRNDQRLYINGKIPFIQTGDVAKANNYITECKTYYNEEGLKQSRLWPKGTLCLTIAANIGDVSLLSFDACFPDSVVGFNVYKPIKDNKFFLYSLYCYKIIFEQNARSTAQKNINLDILSNVAFPIPPLAEQKRIVACLEKILPQVDEYEKAYNELQELNKQFPGNLKNSLLQMAVEGKLVEQRPEDGNAADLLKEIQAEKAKLIDEKKIKKEKPLPEITEDEIPFEIPENWVWCRLNDIVAKEIRRGKSPKYDVMGTSFAFAQKCNSKYNGIRLDLALRISDESLCRYEEYEALMDKDIVINSTGNGTLGRIGMYREIYNHTNAKYYPDSHVTVVRVPEIMLSEYTHIVLMSYHKYLTTLGEGSTNQTELKPLIVKSLLIPLPPLAEQKRIVAKLEELLPLCDTLIKATENFHLGLQLKHLSS